MSTKALRLWTDRVKLHPMWNRGALTEAVFATDLGGITANDSNVPVVNRDPEAFFRATHLTCDLQKVLDEEILASLIGSLIVQDPLDREMLELKAVFELVNRGMELPAATRQVKENLRLLRRLL